MDTAIGEIITTVSTTTFNRQFAMPCGETFSIPPVSKLLDRWLPPMGGGAIIVDPFSRNSQRANLTNDADPSTQAQFHMLAEDFVESHAHVIADAVLFDPPYSPRQIAELYRYIGRACGSEQTQNARLYKKVKDGLDKMLRPGGIAICCGWNSMGFGLNRGYDLLEVLLVPHGAAHNDTIVTVERKQK
jgi:hypothetical protein